jgi:ABC-2 type transport system ATP-binding protein
MAARKSIGYLPETTPLYTEMTVSAYLKFMARLRGVDDVEDAVERAMGMVAVDDHADQIIGHLSKGYRQRVGIAQALVHDPQVVILDEPTIGLDPRQIREVRNLIRELGGDRTLIMSTHILPEAQQVCDRVLIISRGRIVAKDSPEELTTRLAGGEEISLQVSPDQDVEDVRSVAAGIEGVMEVDHVGDGKYRIVAEPGESPRPRLAAAVVERGWPLYELSHGEVSLEDIFLQLTDEEAEADEGSGAADELDLDGAAAEDADDEASMDDVDSQEDEDA